MPSFNKVILMGNLTRDVEMRSLPSGHDVGSFGLAVNDRYKDKSGEWVDRPNYIDCEIFGNRAAPFAQYLSKGSPVFIEGKLRFDQWQDRDGNNRSKLKVVVDNLEFVGGKQDGESKPSRKPSGKAKPATNYAEPVAAEEIPF